VPALGWAQIVAYFGFVEFSGGFEDYKSGTPGDYGWKVLTASNPEEKNKKLSAEIANGPGPHGSTATVNMFEGASLRILHGYVQSPSGHGYRLLTLLSRSRLPFLDA
jgi:hypothetical protein